MPRVRSPERDKAKEIYLQHNGEITNREIANTLNIDEKKVAVWKQRDNWDNNSKKNNVVQQKNKSCTTKKNNIKKSINEQSKDTISIEVKEVMKNDELTENQKLFCIYYTKCFNATKAYQKAYNCAYDSAMVNGNRMLRNDKIKAQIESLTEITFNKAALTKALIQKYIDIAFADMKDYTTFGNEEIEGEFGTYTRSFVNIKDSSEVDGTLITEISQGKDGIKIKFADKMKAMDFLNKHCNLLNDEEKTKLELENKRLTNEKLAKEIKGNGDINKEPVRIVDDI